LILTLMMSALNNLPKKKLQWKPLESNSKSGKKLE